jgi:predicted permease
VENRPVPLSGTTSRATLLLRRTLATGQIAGAFVLLIGAGLLLTSFRAILSSDPGFEPAGVVTATMSLPFARYGDDGATAALRTRLLDDVRALPGVRSAGLTSKLPLDGHENTNVVLPDRYARPAGESLLSANASRVSAGYFDAMTIQVVSGRLFDITDRADSMPVVIIDERLAAAFWPQRDAVGQRLYEPQNADEVLKPTASTHYLTVVGVVEEVQMISLAPEVQAVGAYYLPMEQTSTSAFTLVARTDGDTATLLAGIRRVVRDIDAELPISNAQTMTAQVNASLINRRVPMVLSIVFGAIALFLAAVGVYGVLAYGVVEKRREIGIRMALGSTASGVFRLVLADGLRMVAVGLVVGGIGAYFAGRAMASQLYGVEPTDPRVIAAVATTLAVVALAATCVPARRATRVSPVVSLRD